MSKMSIIEALRIVTRLAGSNGFLKPNEIEALLIVQNYTIHLEATEKFSLRS